MNSLKLLQIYDDDDDDNDDNNNNDDNGGDRDEQSEKLPLPTFCEPQKFSVQEVNKDGKIRNFPHERGNWASYVYVPVETSVELCDYVKNLSKYLEDFNLKICEDFHISLTKTVVLKHHWIEDFTNSVKKHVSDVFCFNIQVGGLKAFTNEQKTRTFLSLKVNAGEEKLRELVRKLDNCLKDYNLPTFYKNPSFHLSLFWCPGDKFREINECIKQLSTKVVHINNFCFSINVTHCICAAGNKNFYFNFKS